MAKEWDRARAAFDRVRFAVQFARPRRYVFVLSHMRSYTSLLCHILHSNPDITGYVEQHMKYQTHLDLLDLGIKVAHTNDGKLAGRYVLDKILHNNAEVAPEVLGRNDVFAVFSIREPGQTIRSTIAMVSRKKKGKQDWKADPTRVAAYYVRRLDRLVEMAAQKPKRSIFFEAERLVNDTQSVLGGLSSFLELKQPLSPRYETFEFTGKPKFGDPGKFISSGHIVSERSDHGDIEIPEEDLLTAKEAYERARLALAERCQLTIG